MMGKPKSLPEIGSIAHCGISAGHDLLIRGHVYLVLDARWYNQDHFSFQIYVKFENGNLGWANESWFGEFTSPEPPPVTEAGAEEYEEIMKLQELGYAER